MDLEQIIQQWESLEKENLYQGWSPMRLETGAMTRLVYTYTTFL